MQILKECIRRNGKHIGSGMLKVDSFLNHQIDSVLMQKIGEEFAKLLEHTQPTKILTAETSGIPPALATGMCLKIPVVYARKHKPLTLNEKTFSEATVSPTHGGNTDLIVSTDCLNSKDRVLIIDDFLASTKTTKTLMRLVEQSGATLVGIGAVIEKIYSGGREALGTVDIPVVCLASIKDFDGEKIIVE